MNWNEDSLVVSPLLRYDSIKKYDRQDVTLVKNIQIQVFLGRKESIFIWIWTLSSSLKMKNYDHSRKDGCEIE